MRMIVLVTVLTFAMGVAPVFGQPEKTDKNLIKVLPRYGEAAYVPSQSGQPRPSNAFPEPSPKDQMYVFWILGKALSYPVDKVESLVSTWRNKRAEKVTVAPAAAADTPNPFDSVKSREIPPAPPAVDTPRNAKAPRDSR